MRRVVGLRCLLAIALLSSVSRAQNVISTIVGGGNPLNGPTLTSASLGAPTSIVQGLDGSFYVSSLYGEYVFKIDGNLAITIFAGTGFSGFAGVGGPATSATLSAPAALAIDANGNLLIADALNHHIYSVDVGTGVLTNVAGSASAANPSGGFGGDGGPATQALLNSPRGIVVFGTTIYFSDSGNNRVRQIDTTTGLITTIAGNGIACAPSTALCGDGGPAIQANLNNPTGLGVGDTQIYVADSGDNRVREVDVTLGTITNLAGTGTACANPAGAPPSCGDGGPAIAAFLNHPTGTFESNGLIYIADQGDQELRAVDGNGNISTIVGDGAIGFSGDGGDGPAATLSYPTGVFFDTQAQPDAFIADQGNNRVREGIFSPASGLYTMSTFAGGGFGGDDGPALSAAFADAYDLTVGALNTLVIVDFANSRIREVAGGVVTTVVGSGTAGYSGDGQVPTAATLNYPRGVAVGAGGIFIADTANHVIRNTVTGKAFGTLIETYAGNGTACSSSIAACGDGGLATAATLNTPNGVAVAANGDLYIADTGDNRVRFVDHTSLNISTLAGTGVACAAPNACGDGGQATLAKLNSPTGIAVDTAGNVFIADSGDNLIRRVDGTTHIITTVAFNGQATFAGDGGPATLASMAAPNKVVVDPAGNLYISGGLDKVVRRVAVAAHTVITVAGNAQQPLAFGFAGDGGPATSATLNTIGLAINATGGLYIADNNRIRFVQLAPTSALAPLNITFPDQAGGVASTPVPVTLTNQGTDDLLISSIVDANAFSQTNNCPIAPAPLAPLQTCTINITFTPGAAGAANDTLIITDNAAGSPRSIPLAGTGQLPFSLTTTCTSLTVVPGQSAIYTVDLAPFKGFTQSVALGCSGAPALATCTVSPSAMTLNGATTVQAKVTATTTAATTGFLKSPFDRQDGNRMAGLVGLAGMAGIGALVILPGRIRSKHARRLFGLIFLLCMVSTVATMSSCGVGGGTTDPPGTASGTYPLTVTATFKSATGTTFTQKVSFNLVVK